MDGDLTALAARFAIQLGVILIAAKLGAEAFERWLGQPAVLGELAVGVLIGPFALGGVALPIIGPIFATGPAEFAIPSSLWDLAEVAAVVLLFTTGLQTDFASFVRFGPKATVVAIGGVILPFAFGCYAMVAAGLAPSLISPQALFVGAALTATSVGVTARVLGDIGKLDSPEGVTILGAAVFDDVIGIVVLAVVVAVGQGSVISPLEIGLTGGRAVATWVILTGLLVLTSKQIARFFLSFDTSGAPLALAVGLALVCGFIAQDAGLAMIIGAFSAGIALSRSRLRQAIEPQMRVVYQIFVPIFFVVVGMLVDVNVLIPVLGLGTILTFLAVASKVIGCGVAALGLGFGPVGAVRIGFGMVPRGEVALIIAGIGLASGAMDPSIFALIVFVAFSTTILAPMMLLPAFRRRDMSVGGIGSISQALSAKIELPSGLFEYFERELTDAFRERGFRVAGEWFEPDDTVTREFRRGDEICVVRTFPAQGGSRHLRVESEIAPHDWRLLVSSAAKNASTESMSAFAGLMNAEATSSQDYAGDPATP